MGILRKFFNLFILFVSIAIFYHQREVILNKNQLKVLESNLNKICIKSTSYLNYVQESYLNKIFVDFKKLNKYTTINLCNLGNDILFTKDNLAKYDGSNSDKKLYLSFLGIVYDVSKGEEHYGPGGSYAIFTGKDASRAFITGDFSEKGLIDDLTGIDEESLNGINEWIEFYERTYKRVGRLIGNFYDENGCSKPQVEVIKEIIFKSSKQGDEDKQDLKLFPPCNIEWNEERKETKYSCSNRSGGIERDWIGLPRRYFKIKEKNFRCACVRNFGSQTKDPIDYYEEGEEENLNVNNQPDNVGDLNHPRIKEFEGCKSNSIECIVKNV